MCILEDISMWLRPHTAAGAIRLLALVTFAFWPHYRAYYKYRQKLFQPTRRVRLKKVNYVDFGQPISEVLEIGKIIPGKWIVISKNA